MKLNISKFSSGSKSDRPRPNSSTIDEGSNEGCLLNDEVMSVMFHRSVLLLLESRRKSLREFISTNHSLTNLNLHLTFNFVGTCVAATVRSFEPTTQTVDELAINLSYKSTNEN